MREVIQNAEKTARANDDALDISMAQVASLTSDDKHRLYCALEARGLPNTVICETLKIAERTGHNWRGSLWHSPTLREELDKLKSDVFSAFLPMLPSALATYAHHLSNHDKDIARDVVDRVWGKTAIPEKTIPDTRFLVKFVFNTALAPSEVVSKGEIVEGEVRELPPPPDDD